MPVTETLADEAWRLLVQSLRHVRQIAIQALADFAVNDKSIEDVFELEYALVRAQGQFNALRVTPALADYVRFIRDDPQYDVVGKGAAIAAGFSVPIARINTTIGGLTVPLATPEQRRADGSFSTRRFTPAETANLRADVQALVDAINAL